MGKMRVILFAAATLACINASQSQAAISLQPGEWQTTETGTENGQPTNPLVDKDCLTAVVARDATILVKLMKAEMQEQGSKCEKFDVQQSGESVTFAMKCVMGQQFLIDMTGTFTLLSSTKYIGAIKTSVKMGNINSASDKKVEAIRIGECKAH
jgi:hypothetical protein